MPDEPMTLEEINRQGEALMDKFLTTGDQTYFERAMELERQGHELALSQAGVTSDKP